MRFFVHLLIYTVTVTLCSIISASHFRYFTFKFAYSTSPTDTVNNEIFFVEGKCFFRIKESNPFWTSMRSDQLFAYKFETQEIDRYDKNDNRYLMSDWHITKRDGFSMYYLCSIVFLLSLMSIKVRWKHIMQRLVK
jgi:hypothetical protein